MRDKKTVLLICCLLVVAFLVLAISYGKLPATIPTHWGVGGKVDGYGSKRTLWYLFALIVAINFLVPFIARIDPKSENYDRFRRAFDIFRVALTAFFVLLLFLMVGIASGHDLDMVRILFAALGCFLALIGNYMPKFKHNYTMGIKTPWTLADEDVWNRTHRMAAPIWVIGGIGVFVSSIFFPKMLLTATFIIVILAMTLVPVVYSYVIFSRKKAGKFQG
ncbi:MAG: SdpI family protein [Spirochaetia bacterium]|nr:SdpI family protein [Spirochaetia bacterium]